MVNNWAIVLENQRKNSHSKIIFIMRYFSTEQLWEQTKLLNSIYKNPRQIHDTPMRSQ